MLSVMKALVAPRWRMPPAPGSIASACSAKWRRWATTSWRVWRSISATRARSSRGAAASSAAICSRRIGRPSSRLGLGEHDPEPAPGRDSGASREERRHLARGVALVERILRLLGVGLGSRAGQRSEVTQ